MEKELIYSCQRIKDLKDLLNQSANTYGNKSAFMVKGEDGNYFDVSYREFKNQVNALGTALWNRGFNGKRVAILAENRYEWCLSYMAINGGLAISVPIDKELPIEEVANLLSRSQSSLVITSKKYEKSLESIKDSVSSLELIICMDESKEHEYIYDLIKEGQKSILDKNTDYLNATIDQDALGILLFTSGTTDIAKGVMLSHRNLCSNIMAVCSILYIEPDDRAISILPLHHTYECTCGFLVMLYSGCTIGFNEGLKYIAKNMQEIKPSIVMLVPLILESLYKKVCDQASKKLVSKIMFNLFKPICLFFYDKLNINLGKVIFSKVHDNLGGHLRLIISGAAGIDPEVSKGLRSLGFKIRQGYGLTECSPIVCVNRDKDFVDSSLGKPLPYIDVLIDKPNKDGIGEIKVRAESVMLGYYENEEATNEVLKGDWFYTGDIGFRDKNGFFYISGRQKNVIVTKNGKNIFPEEVESYLNKSPYILESMVWGKYEDNLQENYVHATIVPDMDAFNEKFILNGPSDPQVHDIITSEVKKINHHIPLYKRIKSFTIQYEELEKTTTKKIKRYKK